MGQARIHFYIRGPIPTASSQENLSAKRALASANVVDVLVDSFVRLEDGRTFM